MKAQGKDNCSTGKVVFTHKKKAEDFVSDKKLRVYKCPECNFYHVTSWINSAKRIKLKLAKQFKKFML